MNVRTRFAPSPTGTLHIGAALIPDHGRLGGSDPSHPA
ncbi:MAG: glutamate--tRNA ligase family protein [Acetobacteraceae bacterium]